MATIWTVTKMQIILRAHVVFQSITSFILRNGIGFVKQR